MARRRAAQLGLHGQAQFLVGDLAATGLPDASCDAMMSLDVLMFVPDKAAATREVARILRPGGRFCLHLEEAGLAVETYQEPPGWRAQQRALAEGIIAAEAEVTGDMGRHSRPWPGSS